MTTSLRHLVPAGALVACVLYGAPAGAVTENYCSFPTSLPTWTFNGDAFEAQSSVIRLTTSTTNEAGSAFISPPISLTATTSLHAHFRVSMGTSATGGDGIAFVMQSSVQGAAALGAADGNLGFLGTGKIAPSVDVDLVTSANSGGLTNANRVGLLTVTTAATTVVAQGTPAFTMAGAASVDCWVDYDGTKKGISIYLSNAQTKPATALISNASVNLFTQLGAQVYVGFTSSTGTTAAKSSEQDVYELELSTDGVPCSCEGDTACIGNASTPACGVSGICTVCSATNHTACTGGTPVCDVPTSTCVGCLANADCSGATPICDKNSLTCRACNGAADCGGATPQCATTGVNQGTCVSCIADANCPPTAPRCSATNTCQQCLGASDCGGNTPICSSGVCKPCASDGDCSGATPACEVWGACGQCTSTNATACKGATGVCDYPTGSCVGCEFNSDCSGMMPTCDAATHSCRACATNADCTGNPAGGSCVTSGMKAGSCVACSANSDCTNPALPVCDTVANLCVACLSNADCPGATPLCNNAKKVCAGCLSSADCSGAKPICDTTSSMCRACQNDFAASNPGPFACPTAATAACQLAGTPLAGQCGLCSSLNDSACVASANTPICVTATATCGCNKDTDCNADNYCDTSTTATGVCTAGCRVVNGMINCSTGKYCTKTDGNVGQCMSQLCDKNADCSAPNGVCDTIVQPHSCVQCLNNTDCASPQVCDKTNHCVGCASDNDCASSKVGPVCLASETCGCSKDSDCGGPSSGLVCDATTHACIGGCRGTGGNGCTTSMVCSSTNNTIGSCGLRTAPMSDAGMMPTGSGADAGSADGGVGSDADAATPAPADGCGCRTAGGANNERAHGSLAVLFAALALGLRRSRKSRFEKRGNHQ